MVQYKISYTNKNGLRIVGYRNFFKKQTAKRDIQRMLREKRIKNPRLVKK